MQDHIFIVLSLSWWYVSEDPKDLRCPSRWHIFITREGVWSDIQLILIQIQKENALETLKYFRNKRFI